LPERRLIPLSERPFHRFSAQNGQKTAKNGKKMAKNGTKTSQNGENGENSAENALKMGENGPKIALWVFENELIGLYSSFLRALEARLRCVFGCFWLFFMGFFGFF
jgi:hypothetical protein